MAESATALLKRWAALKGQASRYFDVCQEIAERVVPSKATITVTHEPNADKTEHLYDSTAVHAAKMLASMIHGTMTPATQPWVSFVMRDDELNESHEVREWLEDCAKRIHKALRQSNFNTAVHEMDWDLVAFGTGCLLIEEKEPEASGLFAGFRFIPVAVGRFVMTEDKDQRADGCFREVMMSRRAVVEQFGEDAVGEAFLAKTKITPDEMVTIIHAVYPRRDRAYTPEGTPKAGAKNMPWVSCYVLQDPKKILSEGGYEEFPYTVPRWSKTTGEVYGTGPSHIALPDIKTINAFVYFMLQAIPMAMQPPTVERSDSVVGDPDLTPGGRNTVDASGPVAEHFAFMDTKYRPDIAADFRIQFSESIRMMYHTNELQLREGPQMTATEVQVRYELMQRLLGPTTGRLESEFLNPLTWRLFAIMARRLAFKALPQALLEGTRGQTSAADLDIEYEGPLARAQRTIEITAQDRVLTMIAGIAEVLAATRPDLAAGLWDVLKLDTFIRDRAVITGLPADSLASEQEVEQLRSQRAQQQAKQQQMVQAGQLAEMAGKAAPMLKAVQQPQGAAA